MKSRRFPLPSLAAAAVLLLLAGIAAPSVHAQAFVRTYFNFNDANLVSDAPSTRPSTIDTPIGLTPSFPANQGSTSNLAPGDPITGTVGNQPLRLTFAGNGNGQPRSFQFTVNTTGLTDLSLSYATRTSQTGITQTLSYSINGGSTFVTVGTFTPTVVAGSVWPVANFNLPTAVNNQASVIFRITLTPNGGLSGAYNDFDNIQLNAAPEPSTIGAAILGTLGLCWHQRRRLSKARQLLKFSRKASAGA